MSLSLRPHLRLPIVALAIALLLSALPSATFAQGPRVTISGSGIGNCGRPVASVRQGEPFTVRLSDFPTPVGAGVAITMTLPDGSIRGPLAMGAIGPLVAPPAVRPVISYTAPTASHVITGTLINAATTYLSHDTWPTGCYTLTAAQNPPPAPPAPSLNAMVVFQLLPRQFPAQSGNLRLSVQAVGTIQATGQQPVTVNIFGQGVPSTAADPVVAIHIVQPNGAIISVGGGANDIPAPTIAGDGSFNVPGGYLFGTLHQPGMHTVIATVTIPPPAGSPIGTPSVVYTTARAQFNLTAPAVTVTNNVSLEMLDRFSTLVPRSTPISIVGRGFNPGPPQGPGVGLALVLPNGVRLAGVLPVAPDGNVQINLPAFGQGFPTGDYRLIASQAVFPASPAAPVFPARTATLTWRLIP